MPVADAPTARNNGSESCIIEPGKYSEVIKLKTVFLFTRRFDDSELYIHPRGVAAAFNGKNAIGEGLIA